MARLKVWQGIVFLLSFLCMVSRHAALTGYYMVKPQVQEDLHFSNAWLGLFDFSYLVCYALGNFVGGVLGDHFPIKKVVSCTMLLFSIVYGFVKFMQIVLFGFMNVRSPWVYFVLFALNGAFQSPVWPATVAVIGNWFSRHTRGSVMGIWSTNSSVGDILGQQTAALFEQLSDMPWEYVILTTMTYNLFVAALFLFVNDKPHPSLLPADSADLEVVLQEEDQDLSQPRRKRGISFWKAWQLPGVLIYALNYACVKLLNYGMMMWLPFYVTTELGISGVVKGALASAFDIGGIVGSIGGGWLTDKIGSRTVIIMPMLLLSVPIFLMFRLIGSDDYWIFFILTPICGFLINGASNLISSAVAADLAQNQEIKDNREALSTVAGIIDGSGGIGAAVGQIIIGVISEISWDLTFGFLIIVAIISFSLLIPLFIKEFRMIRHKNRVESLNS